MERLEIRLGAEDVTPATLKFFAQQGGETIILNGLHGAYLRHRREWRACPAASRFKVEFLNLGVKYKLWICEPGQSTGGRASW